MKIINKSSYPFKVFYYELDKKGRKVAISSPFDEEIQIPSRDQHIIKFGISDIRLEFKKGEVHILDTFVLEDRTGRLYKKRIPSYILEQAQITSIGQKV